MIDYHALLPEILLAATVVAVLVVDLVTRRKYWVAVTGMVGILAAFLPLLTLAFCPALSGCADTTRVLFGGSYVVDGFALVLKGVFLLTVFAALLLSVAELERDRYHEGEYYFLLLAAALGAVVMASARDFITIVVGLELVSGPGFLLAGWRKGDERSNEASLKFFISGVLALALLLFGVSLVYGLTGTQLFSELAAAPAGITDTPLFTLGVVFILLGFGFKVSAVPFHFWTPDTYQGAPTPVTAWLAVGSKTAGFVGLLAVTYFAFPNVREVWGPVLWLVAALSMTIGNIVAVRQTDIVRLLGYSSIAHAGFMLAPFGAAAAGTGDLGQAFSATVTYLLVYAVMTTGAFAVVIATLPKVGTAELDAWAGLSRHAPGLAAMLGVFFFSLAGIPPLGGWFAKFAMFQATIGLANGWGYTIAVIAALNSVVAVYYYAKPVKAAFFDAIPAGVDEAAARRVTVGPALSLALGITTVGILVIGILPGLVASLTRFTTGFLAFGP